MKSEQKARFFGLSFGKAFIDRAAKGRARRILAVAQIIRQIFDTVTLKCREDVAIAQAMRVAREVAVNGAADMPERAVSHSGLSSLPVIAFGGHDPDFGQIVSGDTREAKALQRALGTVCKGRHVCET